MRKPQGICAAHVSSNLWRASLSWQSSGETVGGASLLVSMTCRVA